MRGGLALRPVYIALALLLSACANARYDAALRSHIKHVVIVVQENRSFDNLFHGFPGADTASFGITHKGMRVHLRPVSLRASFDISNGVTDFLKSYDNGRMDGWDLRSTSNTRKKRQQRYGMTPQYAFVPHEETKPYFDLAREFVLEDRFFQSNLDQSFAAHLYLIAGQAGGTVDVPNGRPWGCDASPGTYVRTLKKDRTFGPSVFPCFNFATLAERLDARNISWRYYAPRVQPGSVWKRESLHRRHHRGASSLDFGQVWSSYDAIAPVRFGGDWNTNGISPPSEILSDIRQDDLPSVTWVVPDWQNSDHASSQSDTGPSWVTSIVNAIGGSSLWNSTVVFVLWDDSGGWYDHVPPPQVDYDGLGFRVPLIIASPYVKHGTVCHTQMETASIDRFIEDAFDLKPLAAADSRAASMMACFDFGQHAVFRPIAAPYSPSFFLHQRPSRKAPDDN